MWIFFSQGVIKYDQPECFFFITDVWKEIWMFAHIPFINIFVTYIFSQLLKSYIAFL